MESKQSYNELRKNTIIIGISNIGSKAISFILAPLYSYYLSTSQYGTMDLITTTVGLVMPLLCLDIFEATFRFASDKKYDDKVVLSSSMSLAIIMSLISFVIVAVLHFCVSTSDIMIFSILLAGLDANYQVMSQFARGQNKMRIFALSGVANSLFLLISDIIFMVLLRYELVGWMVAYIIGKVLACVYVWWSADLKNFFSLKFVSKEFYKETAKYSLPLLPSTMMWWIMNASDRYMIAIYLGTTANGIYAVANKMPSLISVFENIFYQAWQTSSISALEDKDRDEFYSNVFKKYFSVLTLGVLALLLVLKPITIWLFAHEYECAWMSTAILVVAVMFHALSGNLGTLYGTFKSTKGALFTSIIGASINIILNMICIPHWGIMSAATTTLIGYVIVLIYRWWDVKKFVDLSIKPSFVIFWLVIIGIQFVLYYVSGIISYITRTGLVIIALYYNKNLVSKILKH